MDPAAVLGTACCHDKGRTVDFSDAGLRLPGSSGAGEDSRYPDDRLYPGAGGGCLGGCDADLDAGLWDFCPVGSCFRRHPGAVRPFYLRRSPACRSICQHLHGHGDGGGNGPAVRDPDVSGRCLLESYRDLNIFKPGRASYLPPGHERKLCLGPARVASPHRGHV